MTARSVRSAVRLRGDEPLAQGGTGQVLVSRVDGERREGLQVGVGGAFGGGERGGGEAEAAAAAASRGVGGAELQLGGAGSCALPDHGVAVDPLGQGRAGLGRRPGGRGCRAGQDRGAQGHGHGGDGSAEGAVHEGAPSRDVRMGHAGVRASAGGRAARQAGTVPGGRFARGGGAARPAGGLGATGRARCQQPVRAPWWRASAVLAARVAVKRPEPSTVTARPLCTSQ